MSESEKFVNEFEYLKQIGYQTHNKFLEEMIEEQSNPLYKDDYPKDFKMNNHSVDDFYKFYCDNENNFNKIGFTLFVNDSGNITLQKTTDNLFIYIEFKGDKIILYNIKCNEDDKVKYNSTVEEFWNEMNERNIMKEFEKEC